MSRVPVTHPRPLVYRWDLDDVAGDGTASDLFTAHVGAGLWLSTVMLAVTPNGGESLDDVGLAPGGEPAGWSLVAGDFAGAPAVIGPTEIRWSGTGVLSVAAGADPLDANIIATTLSLAGSVTAVGAWTFTRLRAGT